MEQNITITEQIKKARTFADIMKEYIIPAMVSFAIAVSAYTTTRVTIETLAKDVASLKTEVYANEERGNEEHSELLERIAGMEAKVDYIYDWVKELRGN